MAPRTRRQLTSPRATALLTLVLAATLGAILYSTTSSLPYLALSPTSDPTFGALNECLRLAVPERLGFAVSRDAQRAAAWSGEVLAVCGGGPTPVATHVPLSGVVAAAFDGEGHLWAAATAADGGGSTLYLLGPDGPLPRGAVRAQRLAGHAVGVVAVEPGGRLLSVRADGEVLGLAELGPVRPTQLVVSADGQRAAVVAEGAIAVFEAPSLGRLRVEAPCQAESVWWARSGHRLLVECGPAASWALTVDADTGASETAPAAPRPRVPSTLVGPAGPYVQPCDMLPCTATEP